MADKKEEKGKEKDGKGEEKVVTLTIRGKEYTGPQIEQALAYAATKLQESNAQLKVLGDEAARKAADPPKDKGKDKGKAVDVPLDDMTGGELAAHLMDEVKGVVKPIAERVQVESNERVKERAKAQITEAAASNPDFWKWETELRTVLEKYPDLSVPEALILARGSDPEKTAKLAGEQAEVKEKEAKDKEPALSGLLPTSGITSRNTHMSVQDAGNAAWDEVGLDRHLAQSSGN